MFDQYAKRSSIPNRFKGKTAVVTGGSCGIGCSIALELLREGASVAITTLPGDEAEGRRLFHASGFDPLILCGDMGDEKFCAQAVSATLKEFGAIHCLVNNAFSFIAKGVTGTREDFERSLRVGPLAFITMTQLVVDSMKAVGGGAIVNISSISGVIAQPNRWSYNGGKGMVNQLTKCMALDLACFGIRVNSVSPGWIWTRENDKAAGYDREKYDKIWGEFCCLLRMGYPVEVASAVLFLLSDDASFITGTDLPVDGGYQSLGPEGIGQRTIVAGTEN